MKRYWLFGGLKYYPCGGIEDLVGTFNTTGEVLKFIENAEAEGVARLGCIPTYISDLDWWHVFDLEEGLLCTQEGLYNNRHFAEDMKGLNEALCSVLKTT